ncbi:hypothetical protein [Blastococcus sp. SYSU DS1024]
MSSTGPQRGNPDLERRSIFDGFKPSDFADPGDHRGWPRGKLRNAFLDRQPRHADDQAAERWHAEAYIAYRAVRELAVLVEALTDWMRDEPGPPTVEQVANQLRVSRQRLTALLKGTSFPQWDLPARIKALIDPSGPRKADEQGRPERRPRSR